MLQHALLARVLVAQGEGENPRLAETEAIGIGSAFFQSDFITAVSAAADGVFRGKAHLAQVRAEVVEAVGDEMRAGFAAALPAMTGCTTTSSRTSGGATW